MTAIEARPRDGERLRRWVKAHRAALTLCLRRRDVPATNNASERALRPFVTARKVFGCARSKEGADAMALLTEWNEFRALDPHRIKSLLKHPVVIDLRNVYAPADMLAAGLSYRSVGRPSPTPAKAAP